MAGDRKEIVKVVSDRWSNLVRKFIYEGFSVQNNSHPTALCVTCRLTLSSMEKNPQNPTRKLPPVPDYDNLTPPPPKTRASAVTMCECQICSIAWKSEADYANFASLHSNKIGYPALTAKPSPAKALQVCSKCFSALGKGKHHICSKTTKQKNVTGILKNSSFKSRGKVASSALKLIAADQGVPTRGGIVNLPTGSNVIPVKMGTEKIKPKEAKFSHENLKRLQVENNLSDRALLKIAGAFRVVAGRQSIEPYLDKSLTERNHLLDDMFMAKTLAMAEKPKKKKKGDDDDEDDMEDLEVDEEGYRYVERVGVFCDDVNQFILDVMHHRGMNPHECDIHCGFDGGQDMLKLAVTVTDRFEVEHSGRSHYVDGVAPKTAKNSSVKKLFLIGVVPKVPENHFNVKTILNQVNIDVIEFTASADVKMLMILVGKSGGKPKFGCPFCSASTPYLDDGVL